MSLVHESSHPLVLLCGYILGHFLKFEDTPRSTPQYLLSLHILNHEPYLELHKTYYYSHTRQLVTNTFLMNVWLCKHTSTK